MLNTGEKTEKMQGEDTKHILYLFPPAPPPTPPQTVRYALPITSSQIWPWASPLSPRIFTHTVTSDHFSVLNKDNTTTASQWCIPAPSVALANSWSRFVIFHQWSCAASNIFKDDTLGFSRYCSHVWYYWKLQFTTFVSIESLTLDRKF